MSLTRSGEVRRSWGACLEPDGSRLLELIGNAIDRSALRLDGARVLTEAATGAYVVTPIIAALAGAARVFGIMRSTRYGTPEEIEEVTRKLAKLAGVEGRIELRIDKTAELLSSVDIVTNSGHVRPIDAKMIGAMKRSAVISLMYEAWELRPEDVDLGACRERGVLVAGVNEAHAAVDFYPYLSRMALTLLLDAGVPAPGHRILLLCDNRFSSSIERGLADAGATVVTRANLPTSMDEAPYDAVLVALYPGSAGELGEGEARRIIEHSPAAVVAQFWGDLDRAAFAAAKLKVWPREAPAPGHMGILPSDIGAEPVVRLQSAGLKVGEIMWRSRQRGATWDVVAQVLDTSGFGTLLP